MTALYPIVGLVVGALVYGFSGNARAAELGLGLYWASTFALMFWLAGRIVHVL